MWAIPKKYNTKCFLNSTGSMISEHVFEAIDKNEAETRAFLNCVIENNRNRDVHVSVRKIL